MNKTNKKSIHKSKNKQNTLSKINEYNQIYKITEKEIENSKILSETEKLISNIYEEIKNATKEYQLKILDICKQLKPDENTFEGKIQKIIFDILKDISHNLHYIKQKINQNKDDISFENNDITQKSEELKEDLMDKLQNFDEIRKSYKQEINKYEAYLINKELGLKEKINVEKDISENKEDKNSEADVNDNHEKLYEKQELYISSKDDIKMCLRKIFVAINTRKKLFFKSLKTNCDNFTRYTKLGLTKINQSLDLKIDFIKEYMDINSNIIGEEDLFKTFIKDDYYTFKFITFDQNKETNGGNITNDNLKNKKNKKEKNNDKIHTNENIDSDELYKQLEDKNIQNMIDEAQKHKIGLSKLTKDRLVLIESNKYIISIVELIINSPEKYDNKAKEKLVQLLTSNIDYQITLLKYLNNYRTKNKFCMKKLTVTILCDFFKLILDLAIKNNNYNIIHFTFVLTLTYYHKKDEENNENKINIKNDIEKIYMTEYLKQNKSFKELSFWTKLLESCISNEMTKLNKKNLVTESQKSFAVYSSIISLIKNMIDYDCEESFILKIIEEIYTKYPDISSQSKAEIFNFTANEIKEREKDKDIKKKSAK